MQLFVQWFKRTFSDPQLVVLLTLLVGGFVVVITMGDMLLPVLAALVIAYLLEGLVAPLQRLGMPRMVAVGIVFILFLIALGLILFGLLPLLSRQVSQLVQQLPSMVAKGQQVLMMLPEKYPELITAQQVQDVIAALGGEVGTIGQKVLSWSLASVVGVITLLVYLVLLPLLVFFFLKDKEKIVAWIAHLLPEDRKIAVHVWKEVDKQISNYIRGKFIEIVIVWSATYVTFALFGLQYAMLLSVLVGLSVVIPYIGATVVTIPVVLVAWFQWGWSPEFGWLLAAYFVVQAIDGNVLVPLLFSEVVSLHPIAIIVAILVFGGFWGFWGVFFAIPLATLVNAVIQAWPTRRELDRKLAAREAG
ncbi:MAG: AI-2E family transporter [Gammaproteobacteria bacterium]|nr:MAG: AI-2E family transporter [Gammaproteobacteria bacterium]RTZ73535.1 MAG: AI-2E family transporter [Gammaproteobacteria bacterium]RTZ77319.1 MAG: AI-2E family transporter [Gammaproteobacteria bacterium]